jgi:hypothetical protein
MSNLEKFTPDDITFIYKVKVNAGSKELYTNIQIAY